MTSTGALTRLRSRTPSRQVPRPVGDGIFEVDGSWGKVQPIEVARGVQTVGELELLEHLECGLPVIDTRLEHFYRGGTIPGARGIPHEEILDRREELDPAVVTVFFCNGPQCTATPDAICQLLGDGYPPSAIRYYRGGMHDWMTLGYPVVAGAA